jgi:hypothetical protein
MTGMEKGVGVEVGGNQITVAVGVRVGVVVTVGSGGASRMVAGSGRQADNHMLMLSAKEIRNNLFICLANNHLGGGVAR